MVGGMKKKKYTQKEMAKFLGIHAAALCRALKAKKVRVPPTELYRLRIEKAHGIPEGAWSEWGAVKIRREIERLMDQGGAK